MSGIIGVSPDMRSGVVGKYPAGHVLQVQYIAKKQVMSSTSAYADIFNGTYLTITKIAGTNILLQWNSQFGKAGASYVSNTKIERATASDFGTGLTALRISSADSETEKPGGSVGYDAGSSWNNIGNYGHTTLDDVITSSAGTYYYRVKFKEEGSGTVYSGIDNGVSTLLAMEVVA